MQPGVHRSNPLGVATVDAWGNCINNYLVNAAKNTLVILAFKAGNLLTLRVPNLKGITARD